MGTLIFWVFLIIGFVAGWKAVTWINIRLNDAAERKAKKRNYRCM